MRRVAVILALIGAFVLLTGVFLPWIDFSGSISGWEVAIGEQFEGQGMRQIIPGQFISTNIHALIVFISAVLIAICVLTAFVLSRKVQSNNKSFTIIGIIILLAAVAAIGGIIGFMVDMSGNGFESDDWMQLVGYGVYVCAGGAILGLISGVLMAIRKQEKRTVRAKGLRKAATE
jgi:hypothetical protein